MKKSGKFVRSLIALIAFAFLSSVALADSANKDWNESASFASSSELIVLMERFKLRQQIPTGFADITNLSVGTWNQVTASEESQVTITTNNKGVDVTAEQDTDWTENYD